MHKILESLNEARGDLKRAAEAYAKEVGGEAHLHRGHNCYDIYKDGVIVAQVYLETEYSIVPGKKHAYVVNQNNTGHYDRVVVDYNKRKVEDQAILIKKISGIDLRNLDSSAWDDEKSE